ncbi:MAG: hypothetical protein F6K58_15540 [Symploca sp. SIO2E9]|nr:hypothetical protein [Symploca sp. SIO2E9]
MSQTTVKQNLYEVYESKIQSARTRFGQNSGMLDVLAPDMEPIVLELYFIYFNALGVAMTDSVEDWIRRAGERCQELGFTEIGELLCKHAQQEAGHHLMMIEDTRTLVNRWNELRTPKLDAQWFLQLPIAQSTKYYRQLHEDVIASEAPFAQVAIEYEIEGLSVRYGSQVLEQAKKILGSNITENLSFMEEHVLVDVGHTQLNAKLLKKLLGENPESMRTLVKIGGTALDTYASFLNHCLSLAKTHWEQLKQEGFATTA